MKSASMICGILFCGTNATAAAVFFRSRRREDNPNPIKLVEDGITAVKANQPAFSKTNKSSVADPSTYDDEASHSNTAVPSVITADPANYSVLSANEATESDVAVPSTIEAPQSNAVESFTQTTDTSHDADLANPSADKASKPEVSDPSIDEAHKTIDAAPSADEAAPDSNDVVLATDGTKDEVANLATNELKLHHPPSGRDLQGCPTTPAWHPTYAAGWTKGYCRYSIACNAPTYATELVCCKAAYAGQVSGHCLSQLPNPPTMSPTDVGGLGIYYPDYDLSWELAYCINKRPLPSGRPSYTSMLSCCKGAYAGQISGKFAMIPKPGLHIVQDLFDYFSPNNLPAYSIH